MTRVRQWNRLAQAVTWGALAVTGAPLVMAAWPRPVPRNLAGAAASQPGVVVVGSPGTELEFAL